mgnify:FL=1|jgi:hypothetical protein
MYIYLQFNQSYLDATYVCMRIIKASKLRTCYRLSVNLKKSTKTTSLVLSVIYEQRRLCIFKSKSPMKLTMDSSLTWLLMVTLTKFYAIRL